MSRESEFRYKYGVFGAGAVSRSLIGSLAARTPELGPVAAASFRVASRIANTLQGGFAVRETSDLRVARVVLFHAPADVLAAHLALLSEAEMEWAGRCVILCHCEAPLENLTILAEKGASIATVREFGVNGFVAAHGAEDAMKAAMRICHLLHLHTVEIQPGRQAQFDAGVTLATAAITPLIDRVAWLLRGAGAREGEASRLAAILVEQSARGFAHSGRQSWVWHIQKPDEQQLKQQLAACAGDLRELLRTLLVMGFDLFGRHKEVGEALGTSDRRPSIEREMTDCREIKPAAKATNALE